MQVHISLHSTSKKSLATELHEWQNLNLLCQNAYDRRLVKVAETLLILQLQPRWIHYKMCERNVSNNMNDQVTQTEDMQSSCRKQENWWRRHLVACGTWSIKEAGQSKASGRASSAHGITCARLFYDSTGSTEFSLPRRVGMCVAWREFENEPKIGAIEKPVA